MREAFMSTEGTTIYSKGMTLNANVELRDFGACRRR